jgi:UDP-N-acetylglucosamine transferase subunit ALG13
MPRTVDRGVATNDTGPVKYLFVASTGGHLAQLVRLSESMNASEDSLWITFESEQSTSLLRNRRVHYVPYVKSRDVAGVLRTMAIIRRVVKTERFDRAVSTGAALALGVFPVAKIHRIPRTYIESVSRVVGPSMTGRIMAGARLAELYTQHESWAGGRWRPHPSVLARFERVAKSSSPTPDELKIFVTLGTIKPYRFDSLVDGVLATGLASSTTSWQLGDTDRSRLPGTAALQVKADEFDRLAAESDVVVTHSGVGTILGLLERGIYPVIVPRRRSRNEHVDDHQEQIASLVEKLGVGEVCESGDLTADVLRRAASFRIVAADGS